MRGNWYQLSLIFLGVVVAALFGVFFYRELFPEYKLYQNIYVQLEDFRSTYTGEPPPVFQSEVKQILMDTGGGGPAKVDRCTSCHVAVQFSHFSPTKIARDVNGNIIYNEKGVPTQETNENYIWKKLDEKIDSLIAQEKFSEAEAYKSLKTIHVGEHIYDVTKVLRAHPLIGRETRPFEYHSIDEYGCTSCHSGNGRGLVTDRAHGPVFDGQYEEQFMGPEPEFLERDPENDPKFAFVFNHKPGHRLLFQTEPLYVGSLIEAKCVQCHQTSEGIFRDAARETSVVTQRRQQKSKAINEALENEKQALASLLILRETLVDKGYQKTIDHLWNSAVDYTLPEKKIDEINAQIDFVQRATGGPKGDEQQRVINAIDRRVLDILGTERLSTLLYQSVKVSDQKIDEKIDAFIEKYKGTQGAVGTLFEKTRAVEEDERLMAWVDDAEWTIERTTENQQILHAIQSEIDESIQNFHRGKNLYFSQACYSCHRIEGFIRGGVGPELTYSGQSYPWYLKESMVWPQADLKTSTMPNQKLDHEELEDLMTFLLAQRGRGKAISETDYRKGVLEWEAGAKMPWEQPINPGNLRDMRYSMTVFASEGCAACHRLKGFESNVGYTVEKGKDPDFEILFAEKQWFQNLFPEEIIGSQIVEAIQENKEEIDRRISSDVRTGSLLEEIEEQHPKLIESFYETFKYASRAKNAEYEKLISQAEDPVLKEKYRKELSEWKERVRRILLVYIQEYGLGRLIGPRPNWSGVYRSDEWLIEHFRKPSRHVARSIMPVMPFDDSKFYALTYMLDVLGQQNRDEVREIWNTFGFDPELAYKIHCSQCHGEFLHGNGPVAEWIYPIPKNLRNTDFLRNYTRENIINSIVHGVKGTPMPPWGEVAFDKPVENQTPVLTESEIKQLVNWLFTSLLGGSYIPTETNVPKWDYTPEDVIRELNKEGNELDPGPPPEFLELKEPSPDLSVMPTGGEYIAALEPMVKQKQKTTHPQSVQEIFDLYPNPPTSPEKYSYYIKKQYYTEDNIKAGQAFFSLNCAVCHGIEADGQGFRAGTMYDAKPRMLTNLHWIGTRDDLRLLRSIKYGVTGTSMTPWGDQTSSLQRLQLVIFIRSLSLEQQQRDNLFKEIYHEFHTADQVLDTARIQQGKVINSLEEELSGTIAMRKNLTQPKEQAPAELYQKELELSDQIQSQEEIDKLLLKLKELNKKEGNVYQTLGVTLIGLAFVGDTFEKYLEIVKLNSMDYQIKNGTLVASFDSKKEKEMQQHVKEIIEELEHQIRITERDKLIEEGKLPSHERRERLEQFTNDLNQLKKVRNSFITETEEAARLRQEQKKIYQEYREKLPKKTDDKI